MFRTIYGLLVIAFLAVPIRCKDISKIFGECHDSDIILDTPAGLRIEGCLKTPCKLTENKSFKVEIDFTPSWVPKQLSVLQKAIVGSSKIGEDLILSDDICKNLSSGSCPLTRSKPYTVSLNYTPKIYENGVSSYQATFTIQDPTSKVRHLCASVDVEVLKSK